MGRGAVTCKSERVIRGALMLLIDFLSQVRRMDEKLDNDPVTSSPELMLLQAEFC